MSQVVMPPLPHPLGGPPGRRRSWTAAPRSLVGLDPIGGDDRCSPRARAARRHALVRRRMTLGVLGLGVLAGAVLLAVAPPLGAAVIAPFIVLLAADLGLLVAHEQRRAEQAMSVAFRSARGRSTRPTPRHRLGR